MTLNQIKKEQFRRMLEVGLTRLYVNATMEGVCVPKEHAKNRELRLDVSYRFYLPVLEILENELRVELSFQGQSFLCVVPWDAVWGLSHAPHQEVMLYADILPVNGEQSQELLDEINDILTATLKKNQERILPLTEPKMDKLSTKLQVVKNSSDESDDEPTAEVAVPVFEDTAQKPKLRLIQGGKKVNC